MSLELARRSFMLLAEISVALASANEGEACIAEAVALTVPELCDLLVVDLAQGNERRRIAFKVAEGTGATLADADSIEIEHARERALEHGELGSACRFAVAPLFARGHVLGAITAVMSDSGRELGSAEVAFLREIGRRIALVVDHELLLREAESVSRTKEEFIATLSHELRTPLTSILGWSTLLRGGELDARTRKQAIDSIERNARAQARVVEEMIDLSRTMTGGLRLQLRSVQLSSLAGNVAASLRPTAASKNISLEVLAGGAVPPVMGDALRLRQIVWHLLSNAIKFTPSGGKIELAVEESGTHVLLTVRDSGEGIPRAFLPHVFEQFSQVDGSSTRRHGGMGLGLAIVRHLTEMHGGTVSAESDGKERGAKFSARFPIRPETPRLAVIEDPDECDGNMEPGVLRGLRVAVIDDDAETLAIIATVLGLCGAEVRTMHPGREACLARFEPDVLVTSRAVPLEMSGAVTVGLEKPIDPDALVSRIAHVLFRAA